MKSSEIVSLYITPFVFYKQLNFLGRPRLLFSDFYYFLLISILEKEMLEHAANLEFEEAAIVRDKIKKIKLSDLELITTKRITN